MQLTEKNKKIILIAGSGIIIAIIIIAATTYPWGTAKYAPYQDPLSQQRVIDANTAFEQEREPVSEITRELIQEMDKDKIPYDTYVGHTAGFPDGGIPEQEQPNNKNDYDVFIDNTDSPFSGEDNPQNQEFENPDNEGRLPSKTNLPYDIIDHSEDFPQ